MIDKIKQSDFVEKFIKELSKELKNGEMKMEFNLTEDEELEYEREEFKFLQDYFQQELSDTSSGEIYIVTDKYENDEYEAAKKELPDYGKEVITPDGKGKVVGLNLLSRIVKVRLHGREIAADYDYEEIKEATAKVAAEKGD